MLTMAPRNRKQISNYDYYNDYGYDDYYDDDYYYYYYYYYYACQPNINRLPFRKSAVFLIRLAQVLE